MRRTGNERSTWRRGAALLLLLLGGIAAGCGGGSGTDPVDTVDPAERTTAGWTSFENADWSSATAQFGAALAEDGDYGEAWNGLGWTYVRVDSLTAAGDASAAWAPGDAAACPGPPGR